MNPRVSRLLAITLIASIVGVLGVGQILAQAPGSQGVGSSPLRAASPSEQFVTLAAGEEHWYAFLYDGSESAIEISLFSDQPSWVEFSVWTPDQIQGGGPVTDTDPVGAGTGNPDLEADLFWTGEFNSRGTYYVRVRPVFPRSVSYRLTISGSGVAFDTAAYPTLGVPTPAAGALQATPTATAMAPPTGVPVTPPMIPPPFIGTSPENAASPGDQFVTLSVGEEHWYAFLYDGDESPIEVSLFTDQPSRVNFGVWTPDQIQAGGPGAGSDPIGAGTGNPDLAADLFWTGEFNTRGTYYVRVLQTGPTPVSYRLDISGSGVALDTSTYPVIGAPTPAPVTSPAVMPATPAVSTPVAPPAVVGTSPEFAASPADEFVALRVGSEHWYAFLYEGDESPIEVSLFTDQPSWIGFGVWTPDQIQAGGPGAGIDPIGAGTDNPDLAADLFWTGSFNTPGTYFVRVLQTGPAPVSYRLDISGSGVTLDISTYPVFGAPTPTPMAPPTATPAAPTATATAMPPAPTETPTAEAAEPTETPTTEAEEATQTPTVEAEEPTETPTVGAEEPTETPTPGGA